MIYIHYASKIIFFVVSIMNKTLDKYYFNTSLKKLRLINKLPHLDLASPVFCIRHSLANSWSLFTRISIFNIIIIIHTGIQLNEYMNITY